MVPSNQDDLYTARNHFERLQQLRKATSKGLFEGTFCSSSSSSSNYQIPNTEHMAYRLVRSLVYKRGVGIRETVWVGVWFGKTNSVGVDLFLPAEPRRRSVPLHGVLDGGVGCRQRRSLGPSERDGQGGGGRGQCAVNTRNIKFLLIVQTGSSCERRTFGDGRRRDTWKRPDVEGQHPIERTALALSRGLSQALCAPTGAPAPPP